MYFDGHDRDDVVQYRRDFLLKLEELDEKSINCDGNIPQLQDGEKPYIRVVHDESTFYANCDQTFHWADSERNVLKLISLGACLILLMRKEALSRMMQKWHE